MYQPISFNVIRQALDWHGFPVPTLRQLSFYDVFEDIVSAEYLATWSSDLLRQRGYPMPQNDGDYNYTVLANRLRDCFCEDVKVTELHYSPFKDELTALIYVKVSRGLAEWAEWLDRQ